MGAVIGIVSGSQMDGSRMAGMRRWSVKVIFEVGCVSLNPAVSEKCQRSLQMFDLHGLEGIE